MFDHHIEEIENPDFQIQFAALSGFSVLELVLSTHTTVTRLLADINTGEVVIQEVYERILHLLPLVDNDSGSTYDGSIAVYLYCLSQFDLALSYQASSRIQDVGGLFWSVQLAQRIQREAQTQAA